MSFVAVLTFCKITNIFCTSSLSDITKVDWTWQQNWHCKWCVCDAQIIWRWCWDIICINDSHWWLFKHRKEDIRFLGLAFVLFTLKVSHSSEFWTCHQIHAVWNKSLCSQHQFFLHFAVRPFFLGECEKSKLFCLDSERQIILIGDETSERKDIKCTQTAITYLITLP